MRTTLTLDDDVAKLLEDARRRTGASLRQLVNEALRTGLAEQKRGPHAKPYTTRSVSLGQPLLVDVDDVANVLATVDA